MKVSSKKRSRSPKKVNKKRARRKKSLRDQQLEMINPHAAGIDVASEEMWVCVPHDRGEQPEGNVRKFGAFTCDLYAIADWLAECHVTSVAMESTGVYWIPLYQVLEEREFEVCLVNARQMKNVSGRPKTDRLDCRWIQRLHSYGLLMPSFRPDEEICQLRSRLRHRDAVIRGAARHIQHLQKALHQMKLLLDKVITDITGVTGTAIIAQILKGERDPMHLAQLRNPHCKQPEADIAKALEGDYRDEHLFVLRQAYDAYHFAQEQMKQCDITIEAWLQRTEKRIDVTEHPLPPATQIHKTPRNNEPTYDARSYLYEIYGVDLTQIPGFQASTIQNPAGRSGTGSEQMEDREAFHLLVGLVPQFQTPWRQRPELSDPKGAKPVGPGVSRGSSRAGKKQIISRRLLSPHVRSTRQAESHYRNGSKIGRALLPDGQTWHKLQGTRPGLLSQATEAAPNQTPQKAGQTLRL
jgi:hypothetical protein